METKTAEVRFEELQEKLLRGHLSDAEREEFESLSRRLDRD